MRGFSMVEALVALVILSVGLLGIATLFIEGMSSNRSAVYRSQAVHLAADLAERIRSNRDGSYSLEPDGEPALQHCIAAGLGCTPLALAQDDLSRWLVAIHDTLPGDGEQTPRGTVSVDTSTTPFTYTLTISWSEPGVAGPLSYVLDIRA
jgi:type IV pilus assembly protein PilV